MLEKRYENPEIDVVKYEAEDVLNESQTPGKEIEFPIDTNNND